MRRLFIAFVALAIAIALVAVTAPAPVEAAGGSQSGKIVALAKQKLGHRFRMGATGPRFYDCSGLVYRTYAQAGLVGKIGGSRKTAAGYYKWFKARGLVSRNNPKPGDLIWWTKNGRIVHTGLWVGSGRALSALINPYGVRMHGLTGVGSRFLAFGHVRLAS